MAEVWEVIAAMGRVDEKGLQWKEWAFRYRFEGRDDPTAWGQNDMQKEG